MHQYISNRIRALQAAIAVPVVAGMLFLGGCGTPQAGTEAPQQQKQEQEYQQSGTKAERILRLAKEFSRAGGAIGHYWASILYQEAANDEGDPYKFDKEAISEYRQAAADAIKGNLGDKNKIRLIHDDFSRLKGFSGSSSLEESAHAVGFDSYQETCNQLGFAAQYLKGAAILSKVNGKKTECESYRQEALDLNSKYFDCKGNQKTGTWSATIDKQELTKLNCFSSDISPYNR